MILYVMMILSLLYVLLKEKIVDLKNIKTILVVLGYICLTTLLTYHVNTSFVHISFRYLMNYGLAILAVILISNNKRKAVFYTLNVLFIGNVINYLVLYTKLWYWYDNDVLFLFIPFITLILYHCRWNDVTDIGFVWNILCIVVWEILLSIAVYNVLNINNIYLIVIVFIVWMIIHKVIYVKEQKVEMDF